MKKESIPFILIILMGLCYIALTVSMITLPIQPTLMTLVPSSEQPTVNITLYGGEISDHSFGYGFSPDSLSSPGPLLKFKTTDIVKITFINTGKFPHTFIIKDSHKDESNTFFNSAIGSTNNPILPAQSGTIIFRPERTGSYFYISQISSDAELGMWGNVQVPIN